MDFSRLNPSRSISCAASSLFRRWCGLVVVLGLMLGMAAPVHAQTGPGGVGTTDGNSSLELWLRADKGVSGASPITGWADQSGNGNDANTVNGNPNLVSTAVNDTAAIRFDGGSDNNDDGLEVGTATGALTDLANGPNTLIIVSKRSANVDNQYIFSAGETRVFSYRLKDGNTTFDLGVINGGNENKGGIFADGFTSGVSRMLSSVYVGGGGESRYCRQRHK